MVKGQRKTRKITKSANSSKKHILTIPELRKAFDHMDKVVEGLRKTAKDSFSDAVSKYRDEWHKTFKHELSPADAAAYLKFRYGLKSGKTRRSAKLRGGAMAGTSGASLDYSLRAGVSGVYGNFPTYQTQGLDRYYGSAISADCGNPNGFPTGGSAASQAGGGLLDGLFRPLIPSPGAPSASYGAMMTDTGKGQPAYPSADASGQPPYRSQPIAYIPPGNLASYPRSLGTDVYKTAAGPAI